MNVTELRNQTVDLIWNGLTITDERQRAMTFSEPYLVNQQVLVVKKSQHIHSPQDMTGKTLGFKAARLGPRTLTVTQNFETAN